MKARKSLLALFTIAVLASSSYVTETASAKVSRTQVLADGTDPMPRPPRGTSNAIDEAASVIVADGTDPMPRPPRSGSSIAATGEMAPSVLVADGTDPMPPYPPHRLA